MVFSRLQLSLALVLMGCACGSEDGVDAGRDDAGERADAAAVDAGHDAGAVMDAGGFDAGAFDAGAIDSGGSDAAAIDAGRGIVASTSSYRGWDQATSECTVEEALSIYEPDGGGSYPVFLYSVGTGAIVSSEEAQLAAREMASRGFVAAVVQYDTSLTTTGCSSMLQKADCAYSGSRATSAVSVMCARTAADCSMGIVVAGLSQGASLAILARNFDDRVRGAWLMAFGGGSPLNIATRCFIDSETALSAERMRIVNGIDGQAMPLVNLQNAAGTSCSADATSCFAANGSGWYLVTDGEVEDGNADHCYFVGPGPDGSEVGCSNEAVDFDVGWRPPATLAWSLATNLDWLAAQARIP